MDADTEKSPFERIVELIDHLSLPKGSIQIKRTPYPSLTLLGEPTHRVIARSGHLGRSLRGNEATHIVVDEAAFVPEALISEVALPMLATTDGQLMLLSTPNGMNHFWRFFEMGQLGENGVWSRRSPSAESPYVVQTFLDIQRQLISERAFEVEYEAKFVDSAGRVFRTEKIDACLKVDLQLSIEEPVSIGIDFGRYRDFTAVVVVTGNKRDAQIAEIHRFNRLSWTQQVHQIAEILARFNRPIVSCDSTGIGDAVSEQLQNVSPGSTILPTIFTNESKRSMIEQLAWLIDAGGLKMLPHMEMIRELQHFEAKPLKSGATRYEACGGYHDDLVMALALATSQLYEPYTANLEVGRQRTLEN